MQKTKRNRQIDQQIINLYNSGLSTYEVAEKIKCSQTCVLNCLKQNNITRRSTSSYNTKYITNYNFFDKIDNEQNAYFLGLLYADGNVYVKNNHSYEVSIQLQESDKLILEKLRDYLCKNLLLKQIINKKNGKLHYLLKINSKELCINLINLGCIPDKSLKLKFPEIKKQYIVHFIRGYFDGDGSLYSKKPSKTGHVNYGWQITSTFNFCNYVKNYLLKMGIHSSMRLACKTNTITYTLSVGGNKQVKKLLDWIYLGANIYLDRKHDKYVKLKTLLMEG